jgi:membrane peptidoglycan carboxypeptidase
VLSRSRSIKYPQPPEVSRPISPETARVLRGMMEGVVTEGTGRSAGVPGYHVAGKTGTAQIPSVGGYLHNSYLPSFVGFAPSDDPVIVGVVAVAEPQGAAYHGGQVAAPVFGAVARQVLLHYGLRPERPQLASWPGQTGSAEFRHAVALNIPGDDVPSDGDDVLPAATDPIFWREPAPAPAAPAARAAEPARVAPEAAKPAPGAPAKAGGSIRIVPHRPATPAPAPVQGGGLHAPR